MLFRLTGVQCGENVGGGARDTTEGSKGDSMQEASGERFSCLCCFAQPVNLAPTQHLPVDATEEKGLFLVLIEHDEISDSDQTVPSAA